MSEPSRTLRLRGLADNNFAAERPLATFTPLGLSKVVPVLVQNWRLIAACTVLALVAVIAALPLMGTRYVVGAKVLVELGREMSAPPTVTAKDSAPQVIASKRPEDLGSEMEIMRSPQLVEDVVRSFGVDYFLAEPPPVTLWQYAKHLGRVVIRAAQEQVNDALVLLGVRRKLSPFERVVVALRNAVSVDEIRKSDVINISLQTPNPETGVAILRRFLELYQEKHIATYRSPAIRAFFADAAAATRDDLQAAEARLARFKDEHKAWSVGDQAGLLLRSYRDLADAQARNDTAAAEIVSRVGELRRQQARLPDTVPLSQTVMHDPVIDELRKQLAETQAQIAQNGVLLGERSPQIAALRQQAESLRDSIAARSSTRRDQELTGTNQRLIDAQREIASGEAQLAGLQAVQARQGEQRRNIEHDLHEIAGTEQTLDDLQRDLALLDRKYQLYTNGLEDSRISEALDLAKISNVRVVSAPVAEPTPVWPPLVLVLVGGLIVGLGGSVSFVLFRDAMFPRARMPREIEQLLGLPVLASIPETRGLRARA
jgi:uncharacterized protein involved in exopolysaccharide biosynthesis